MIAQFIADTTFLATNGTPEEQAIASEVVAVLENRVEVGLYFALPENSGDLTGEAAYEAGVAALAGVDETQESVDAAKERIDEGGVLDGGIFTLTTDIGEIVEGTAGDDVYNAQVGGGANETLNQFDQIADQGGNDELNLVVRGNGNMDAGSSIDGVEVINIDQSNALFNQAGGVVPAGVFGGAEQIWQVDGFQNITGLSEGQVAGFRDTMNLSALGAVALYGAAVADVAVALEGVNSGGFVNVAGNGLTSVTVSGSVDAAAPGVAGALGVGVNSQDVLATTDTDIDTDVETLTLNLTSDVQLTVGGNDAVDLVTVDASGSTGGIATIIATGGDDVLAIENIMGGSGDDSLMLNLASFSAATVAIDGGAGNDTINIIADGTASTSAVAVTITGGEGSDTVDVDFLANILTPSSDGITAGLVTVADFNAAEDLLDLSGLLGGSARDVLTNPELADIGDEATLSAAVTTAATYTNAGGYATFNYGGDMYVYANNNTAAFDTTDGLIKVTGMSVAELDGSNFAA